MKNWMLCLVFCAGCGAKFIGPEDLRPVSPPPESADSATTADVSAVASDTQMQPETATDAASRDTATAADTNPPTADASASDTTATDTVAADTSSPDTSVADTAVDSSDASTADAPDEVLLNVTYDGPVMQNRLRGSSHVDVFDFSFIVGRRDLLIRRIPVTLSGLTAHDRVRGSLGTDYFRNVAIVDRDTGETIMGPMALPAVVTYDGTRAELDFYQPFTLYAHTTRRFAILVDVVAHEDAYGEFLRVGPHGYRATVGTFALPYRFLPDNSYQDEFTGEYYGPGAIRPNFPVTGNIMYVVDSRVQADLASTPVSTTYVTKEEDAPSLGFVLTASAVSDLHVTGIALRGVGSLDGHAFVARNWRSVNPSCGIYDNLGSSATLLGSRQTPRLDGTLPVTDLDFSLPAGTSRLLFVRCATSSTVTNPAGDQYAIGIGVITATDRFGLPVSTDATAAMTQQNGESTGARPVVMTVIRHGELTVREGTRYPARNLLAGGEVWQAMAEFQATARYEDVVINRAALIARGPSASFTRIALAVSGRVIGMDVMPSGVDRDRDLDLSREPLVIPRDVTVTFSLWAQLAPTISRSTTSSSYGAFSGNQIALSLEAGRTTGEWNVNYARAFNLRADGATSGDRIYADGVSTYGSAMTVRRSQPNVRRLPLMSTSLLSGTDTELYAFQVGADPAGSISLKQVTFNLSRSMAAGSSLDLSQFRLRRGAVDITSGISIVDHDGTDLYAGHWPDTATMGQVIISFTGDNEDVISGVGNAYTLHARLNGTVMVGDSIQIAFLRTSHPVPQTGYLFPFLYRGRVFSLDDGHDFVEAPFIWSDLSELPHSANLYDAGGSPDWSNDLYLEDLAGVQVLSR